MLEVRDLSKDFGGLRAINRLTFQVREGDLRAIIGPNGAGKSTFFNLLAGRTQPTEGTIRFRGEEISHLPPYRIARRGVALAFQVTNLFPNLTAFENIRIAAQRRRRFLNPLRTAASLQDVTAAAEAVLAQLGLEGERWIPAADLSHGQQKHLEIGIALATQPRLLLLDEPTAGMSAVETRDTVELIQRLAGQVTMIIVEHDMEVVMSLARSITVLHQGQVLAEGPPEVVRADPEVQRVYLGRLRSGS